METRAVIIAGTQSGSGKTTITLGLMAALAELGHNVVPFKCGPDFIDPSLHHLITGKISRNLDLWMAGEKSARQSFNKHSAQADIAVIEGVMGMFDGGVSSSAALAAELEVPIILVLDARSAAESVAAVLKGFETLDPAVAPKGVILNMICSKRHLELVSGAIHKHCQAEILGYLPRTTDFTIPSRHLGLHMGEESPITKEKIATLSQTVIEHIDINKLLQIAAVEHKPAEISTVQQQKKRVRLGVARDKAFCFYYQDNLDILEEAGAEVCFFSPLEDTHLPADLDGIYLGGGYPELYAEELSSNTTLLQEIKKWAESNRPLYAECGGFMYLTQGIINLDNQFHAMAAVFPMKTAMQTKRASLGYRELTTTTSTFFGPKGTVLRGHEFHYSRIESMDSDIEQIYLINNDTTEGYRCKNVIGGYMHLHFGFNPQAAMQFVNFCETAESLELG
jgi:cobyrinic acid a,c-diamide synthase